MEDVVVLGISSARHSCKVCGKGFLCGRSLGGHMRSHSLAEVAMAAAADDADSDDDDEQSGTRGANGVAESGGGGYYGLRENPKKTRRLSGLADGGGEDERHGDRGELFSSCEPVSDDACRRASVGEEDYAGGGEHDGAARDDNDEEEEAEQHVRLVPAEAAVLMPAPRRRRRSMRVPAPAPPPAAFDREPEDVALCLIMLSRDTPGPGSSRWGSPPAADGKRRRRRHGAARRDDDGGGYYHHDADSDDASAFFPYADVEATRSRKRKPAAPCLAGDEKRGRYECPGCGRAFQSYQALGGHRASHKRINSSCCITKGALDQPEPSVETNTSFSTASAPASPEVDAADRAAAAAAALKARKMASSKFECPICFKVFGSGQALGGHKRSHSIAGELYERADAGIVEPEQSLVAARFLDLNLPAPAAED